MFNIDYLTESMNYIPVSKENKVDPDAGSKDITNSAGIQQTSNANEEEEAVDELIVVPAPVQTYATKDGTKKPSTTSKKRRR